MLEISCAQPMEFIWDPLRASPLCQSVMLLGFVRRNCSYVSTSIIVVVVIRRTAVAIGEVPRQRSVRSGIRGDVNVVSTFSAANVELELIGRTERSMEGK